MNGRSSSWPAGMPAMLGRLSGPWWTFLVSGVAWLLISLIVLRFSIASVATVGVLIGVVFLLGTFSEIMIASARVSWRWWHILMGALFFVGALWAFSSPFGAFWALAEVVGLLLILRGSLDLITSLSAREVNHTWWLGTAAGLLEILIGFWAAQQMFPARAVLLIFWVGFLALFRGISDIVVGFELRATAHA